MLEDCGLYICWDAMVDQLEEAETLACLSNFVNKLRFGKGIGSVERCRLVRCVGADLTCVLRPKSMIGGSLILCRSVEDNKVGAARWL